MSKLDSVTASSVPADNYVTPSPLTQKIAWVLRTLILASGIYQMFWGEPVASVLILACLAGILVPQIVSFGKVKSLPIEFEIVLFIMVLLQFVIGEARDFYTEVPYFDKLVHFILPMLTAFIGFLIVYSMYYHGKLKASLSVMFWLIVFVALGVGALWEIGEYLSDEILLARDPNFHQFQGSMMEDPLHDTMNDLIFDMVGGIAGAALGVWYIRRGQKQLAETGRLHSFMDDIETMWAGKAIQK